MISVVILTYNRIAKLIRCLDVLYAQPSESFEVVVVDNGSTDDTPKIIKAKSYPRLKLIANPGETNFSQSRNLGVENSTGDVIAFTDDDCVPAKNWLERIDLLMQEYDSVGGPVLELKKLPYPPWWHPEMNWIIGLSSPGHFDQRAGSVYYPQTANLAIKKHIFEKERFHHVDNEFKEGKWVYAREDSQLWKNLRIKGYKISFDQELIVYHDIPENRLTWNYAKTRSITDGMARYYEDRSDLYLDVVLSDIAGFPLNAIRSLLSEKAKEQGNLRYKYLWFLRQIGFVKAYISNGNRLQRRGIVLSKGFSILANIFKGMLKHAFRIAAVPIYKTLYRRKTCRADLIVTPKAIIVFAAGFLGDMVVIIPALRLIKKTFPDTHLTLVCFENGYCLLEPEQIVDEIVVLKKSANQSKRQWVKESLAKINSTTYDVGIVHYFHNAPPEIIFRSKVAHLIGFDTDIGFKRQFWYDLLDVQVEKDLYGTNEIGNSMKLLRSFGINAAPEKYALHFTQDERKKCEALVRDYNLVDKKVVAIHIGGFGARKIWKGDNWVRLVKMLEPLADIRIVFFSGPDETAHVDQLIRSRNLHALNLCGKANPRELSLFLTHCTLLITTCSGPKHLAFISGAPTITLYGSMDYSRWKSNWDDDRHPILKSHNLDLTHDERLGLPEDHLINLIPPEMVFEEVKKVLT